MGLIITTLSIAQNNKTYLAGKLKPESPPVLDSILEIVETKIDSYISIKTGVDSIKVLFGEASEGINKGYWTCTILHDSLKSFETLSLEMTGNNGRLSQIIGIMYDSTYELISLKIEHNPKTNEIYYIWLRDNKGSKIIPKPKSKKQKNTEYPPFPVN